MALPAESEGRSVEEVSLIDILYKDEYRIDSYLAQLFNDGVLRRSKLQTTDSLTDAKSIGGSIKIFSGNITDGGTSSTMEEMRFVPHDRNVITLLEMLDLEPQELLSGECAGRLVCLKGRLAVRDFKKFNEILSVMAKKSKIFNINQKEARDWESTFEALSKVIPMNVEAEVILKDNSAVRGILKENYLLTAYRDIVATHGNKLPGVWCAVGILDSLKKVGYPSLQEGFRRSMDAFSAVAETLYREGNPKYTITPFLIFRSLNK